jgi:hypothetical protein
MQVCQEADRFRMARPNDDTAVESFKRLDLDYLEVGDNYGLHHAMLQPAPVQSIPKVHSCDRTQDIIPNFFRYSQDADPLMLCERPHAAANYVHAPDYELQLR